MRAVAQHTAQQRAGQRKASKTTKGGTGGSGGGGTLGGGGGGMPGGGEMRVPGGGGMPMPMPGQGGAFGLGGL